MKINLLKFFKIWAIFLLYVFVLDITLELLLSPENHAFISEYGWETFLQRRFFGILIFYIIFNTLGSFILFRKEYEPKKMGILSLVIAMFLEFTFMRPEWVENIYTSSISGDTVGAFAVTTIFWFSTWYVPSYIAKRFETKRV